MIAVINKAPRGIALIMVMLVIIVMSVLAAGFAYTMKVETKLARNAGFDDEMEWLGRSGVELARYVIAQQLNIPNESSYDALYQKWAGGPGGTNDLLADISLDDVELGHGKYSVKIIDLERKLNLNFANREIIERALDLMGVDAFDATAILDSIQDWRDPDSDPHLNGTESDYYLTLPHPYVAKDGPFDDLSELLLVRGITPEIYWGTGASDDSLRLPERRLDRTPGDSEHPSGGLFDLFNTLGRLQVNINTAPAGVLQLLPGMDRNLAEGIVAQRAGLDGMDGTEDDTPFESTRELLSVPGMAPLFVQQLQRFVSVRSFTFEARVHVEIDRYKRQFVALLFRNGPRQVQILTTYWE